MWSSERPEATPDEIAQLLRWGRAQRISLNSDDALSFDDDDLFTYEIGRAHV